MGLVKVVATVAVVWLMVTEGLGVDVRDILAIRRRLSLLLRAFLAVDVFVPLVTWALLLWIHPTRPVAGALALLAACPIAPLALRRIGKAGGSREIAAGIHVTLALLAIVTTPLTIGVLGGALGFEARIPPLSVARQLALALLLPLAVGLAVRARWPALAMTLRRPGGRVAIVLLAAVFLLVLVTHARALVELGLREYGAMIVFVLAALAIGHSMGGRDARERTVFALETASRNLGLTFFIASLQPNGQAALPVIVPYIVIFAVLSTVYLRVAHGEKART